MISALASILRFIFRTTLFTGFLLLALFPWLMLVNHYRSRGTVEGNRKADRSGERLSSTMVWFFGIRTRVIGKPSESAVLVAANHITWLDIPVLHTAGAIGFVGKAEIQRWPIFNFVATTGGTIFHQRGSHDSANGVATLMVERLKQGRRVAIFPEGGIFPGNTIRMFHARMFRAAIESDCPVQPVMLRYMRNGKRDDDISFRPNESMMVNFKRVLSRPGATAELHFLPLIESTGKPRRELSESARTAIMEIYDT